MARKQAGAQKTAKETKEEKGSEVQAKAKAKAKANANANQDNGKNQTGFGAFLFRIIPKQNLIAACLALVVLFFSIQHPDSKLQFQQTIYGNPKGWSSDKRVPEEANFSMAVYPSQYATELTVKTFYETVDKAPPEKLFMVVFFDPWSKDYRRFGGFIDRVAKRVKDSFIPDEVVEICMVNAGLNNYLLRLYAPEQLSLDTWQEDPDDALYSFRFGKPNYFPMVVTLFRAQAKIATYPYTAHAAMLTEDKLFGYVQYHLGHWNAFEEYDMSKEATMELCGYNSEGCSSQVFDQFNKWGEFFRGENHYVVVENEDLCHKPCTVSLYRKDLVRYIQYPTKKQIVEFMRSNKANFLTELTEKKGAHLQNHYDYMCVVLLDIEDQEEWVRAERAIWNAREMLIEQDDINIGFVWAPMKFTAEQFGLEKTDATALSLYRFEDRMYAVLKDTDLDFIDIHGWLVEHISNPELLDSNYFTPEEEEEADEARKQREAAKGDEEDDEAEDDWARDMLIPDSDEDEDAEQEEEKKKQKNMDDLARELDLPWHAQIISETVYKGLDFEQLWKHFRDKLLHYKQMEIIYANLPPAEQAKEHAFRTNLNRFRKFLQMDPDGKEIQPLISYFPVSPKKLGSMLEDSADSRRKTLRAVERFSGSRMKYRNKIEVDKDEDYHRRLYRTTHMLHQILIELYVERSQEFIQSPEYDPKQTAPEPIKIDRRDAASLSYKEFLSKYASKGIPVVLTNVSLFKTPLTLERLIEACGDESVDLKFKGDEHTWAGLSDADDYCSLREFIESFSANETMRKFYLHDWTLPDACPLILGLESNFDEFIMPKFFAGDYFQRMPYNTYENSWPSLFIGAEGTESGVHVDSGGTNFWLHLVSGEKKWRIFDKESIHNMYVKPGESYFYLDVFRPDLKEFPLFVKSKMYEFTQKPGELVFIPGDSPHAVQNTEDIIAISSNYMDDTNRYLYLWHSLHEEEFRRFELYTNPNFPIGLDVDQEDLNFGDYKSRNWFTAKLDKTLYR